MRRINSLVVGVALVALVGAPASAHELDHPVPGTAFNEGPVSTQFNAGGQGAEWELVTTIVTGNPHSDLEYFTSDDGELYASVGTLAAGGNAGGQTIVRLTDGGRPSDGGALAPEFVAGHPSAACPSNPSAALGLQHDVEATPKGEVFQNIDWGDDAVTAPAQLLLDATDADGRCHDQGTLGLSGAPQGGIELIDVTDPANPVEIALTSHVGEAHTVNVDPSRPHIAYVVTSDAVGVSGGQRQNEVPGSSDQFDLDGFEMLDLSSCLTAPYGTMQDNLTTPEKREACQPEVYRFRYPALEWSLGHTNQGSVYGCHELELHPGDVLTCGSGAALIVLDMSDVFTDDNGDGIDEVVGNPLACATRTSTSAGPFTTGAMVTDCVDGAGGTDLSVPAWLGDGAPSVEGVEYLGSIHHQGRETTDGAFQPAFDATEDIDFNHEAELTHSGQFMLATDERGGGVVGGAQCSPGVDLTYANGGIHAYRVDGLRDSVTEGVPSAEEAHEAYALTPDGEPAIARAPINTQPQATECTAHLFHQIPGQNRIFMAWYSQGTQVFDYVEGTDATGNPTFEWHHVGYFIPEYANTWVSEVFDFRENEDGSWTYLGATGDFNVGNGRGAMDVYEVTLPAPRQFADGSAPEDPEDPEDPEEPGDRPECDDERPGQQPPHCDDDGRPGDDRRGNDQDEAAANDGRGGGESRPEDNGSEGRTRAAAGDTRPAPTPTTVIDLRPAASGTAPSSSPSVPASLSLLLGLSLLLIGVTRRRRAD